MHGPPLTPQDCQRAADRVSNAFAQAFQDDPVVAWVTPDATRRRALLPATFGLFAEAYMHRPHRSGR